MALVIKQHGFLTSKYLKVKDQYLTISVPSLVSNRQYWEYSNIDFILMSPDNVLSIQQGGEVFSIRTKPSRAKHQRTIRRLVELTASAHMYTGGFPVLPVGQ